MYHFVEEKRDNMTYPTNYRDKLTELCDEYRSHNGFNSQDYTVYVLLRPLDFHGDAAIIYGNSHGQSRSRDVSTEWSIDWFPVTIWCGTRQGCYFISKMEAFSPINILLKNNLSNNWNNPI